MKKLLSVILSVALIASMLTCIQAFNVGAVSGLPEKEEDLERTAVINGTGTGDGIDGSYADCFGRASDAAGTPATSGVIGLESDLSDYSFTENGSENYYWFNNGYTAATTEKNMYSYLKGIDLANANQVSMETEVLTPVATSYFTYRNSKMRLATTFDDSTKTTMLAIYSTGAFTPGKIATYIEAIPDENIVNTTLPIKTNNTTTVTGLYGVANIDGVLWAVSKSEVIDGVQYYSPYKKVVLSDAGDYYNVSSNVAYAPSLGLHLKFAINTSIKDDGNRYIDSFSFTLTDMTELPVSYRGTFGTGRLVLSSNAGTNMTTTVNSDGTCTYTISSTTKHSQTKELLAKPMTDVLGSDAFMLPIFGNTVTGYTSCAYFKNTTIQYSLKTSVFLEDFNIFYNGMINAGVTTANVNENLFEMYVVPARTEYNHLTDYLKGFVTEKAKNLSEIEEAYYSSFLTDFNAAYDEIKNVTPHDSAETILSFANKIVACRDEYNKVNSVAKPYISEEKLSHLQELEQAYNDIINVKSENVYINTFSGDNVNNLGFSTSFLKSVDALTDKYFTIYNGGSGDWAAKTIKSYFPLAVDGEYDAAKFALEDGAATRTVTVANGNAALAYNVLNSISGTVDNAYLPKNSEGNTDIKSVSVDVNVDFSNNQQYNDFIIMYGTKDNAIGIPRSDLDNPDVPTFGTLVRVYSDGTVNFGNASYESHDIDGDDALAGVNYIRTSLPDKTAFRSDYSVDQQTLYSQMITPGDFSTEKVSLTGGKLTLKISFSKGSFKLGGSAITAGAVAGVYAPEFSVTDYNTDGTANKTLTGARPLYSDYDIYANQLSYKGYYGCFPNTITGFSISESDNVTKSNIERKLSVDNIIITGNQANEQLGASVRKTANADEQNLRFHYNMGVSSYLIEQGYSASAIGCIAAIEYNFQKENLTELTVNVPQQMLNDKTALKYEAEIEDNNVPADVYFEMGKTAITPGAIGLQFRTRAYIKYTKQGADDIYIYTSNNINGKVDNGECVRSVYSVAKSIANAEIANAQSLEQDVQYDIYGSENATAFENAMQNIINGAKSTVKVTIGGTEYTNGQILLAFTSANSDFIQ